MENKTVYLVLGMFFANFFGGLHGMASSAEMMAKLAAAVLAANQAGYMPTAYSNSGNCTMASAAYPALASQMSGTMGVLSDTISTTTAIESKTFYPECNKEKPFTIKIPNYSKEWRSAKIIAEIRKTIGDEMICSFGCGYINSPHRVKEHMQNKLNMRDINCQFCDQTFNTSGALKTHNNYKHFRAQVYGAVGLHSGSYSQASKSLATTSSSSSSTNSNQQISSLNSTQTTTPVSKKRKAEKEPNGSDNKKSRTDTSSNSAVSTNSNSDSTINNETQLNETLPTTPACEMPSNTSPVARTETNDEEWKHYLADSLH